MLIKETLISIYSKKFQISENMIILKHAVYISMHNMDNFSVQFIIYKLYSFHHNLTVENILNKIKKIFLGAMYYIAISHLPAG